MTNNARSAHYLQKLGYKTWRVESYNHFARRKTDLWGIFDLEAMNENELIGVQSTSRHCISARRNKMLASPYLRLWQKHGKALILGWFKKNNRWQVKSVWL